MKRSLYYPWSYFPSQVPQHVLLEVPILRELVRYVQKVRHNLSEFDFNRKCPQILVLLHLYLCVKLYKHLWTALLT